MSALERGAFLYSQKRFDEAKAELATAMVEMPGFSHPVLMMALCHLFTNHPKEAVAEAERGLSLDPENDWGHFVLGLCQLRTGKQKQALASLHQALLLNSEEPQYYSLLSEIYARQGKWTQSLSMADLGLAIDPEDAECLQFRSQALSHLGRKGEALDQAQSALELDPDSARAHADLGWIYLQRGERKPALDEFKEALRIEPGSRRAQEGLKESLRATFPPYRLTMAIEHRLASMPPNARILAIMVPYILLRATAYLNKGNKIASMILLPIIVVFWLFIFMRRVMEPLANITLLFNPLGRLALGPEMRREMVVMLGYISCAPIFLLGAMAVHSSHYIGAAWMAGTFVLVLMAWTVTSSPVAHRIAFWSITVFCGALGILVGIAEIAVGGK